MAICDSVESCGELAEQLLSGDMTAILGLGLLLLILGVPVLWRLWSRRAKPGAEKPKPSESSGGGNQITIGTMSGGKAIGGDDHSFSLHSPQNGVVNTGDNVEIHNHQGLGGADVDQIVQTLLQHHQNERQADQETIKSLTAAVEALSRAAEQPDATPDIRDALEQLKAGDQKAAEAIFAQILVEEQARGQRANKKAAEAARHLGALAFLHDTETALAHFRTSTELDPDDPDGWNELGHLLKRVGKIDEAISAFNKVIAIGENLQDQVWVSIGSANLGLIYRMQGNLEQAETMHKCSLAIDQKLGRKEGVANALSNLSLVYSAKEDLDQAEEKLKSALAINEELGRKEGAASQLGNLAMVYHKRGDLDQALDMYKRSLSIHKNLDRKEGIANDLSNLGLLYLVSGELKQAEDALKQALAINQQLYRKEGIATQLGNLGALREQQGDTVAARDLWQQALALYAEIGAKPQMEQVRSWLSEARGCHGR